MLLGSASAAFLLIREIRVAKNRLFPEGKIYIFFEFCTQFLANPSLDPNCSDYESSVCIQERGSLPLNGDFVLPQLLARTPRQRQGTGATSSASSQPSAGLCQIHSCPGSSYRHPNLRGASPQEARGLNRKENHLCSSAERRLAEPEMCTHTGVSPSKGRIGRSSSPIRFSRSAASLGVALGRIPGSLKLVWSRQLMTKKKRTAAMMGMARVRWLARKGQLRKKKKAALKTIPTELAISYHTTNYHRGVD